MTVSCHASEPQTDRDPRTNNMRWQQNIIAMADRECHGAQQIHQLNTVVDISSEEAVKRSIQEIARAVFPSWDTSKVYGGNPESQFVGHLGSDPDKDLIALQLSVKILTGGLTNKLFLSEYLPTGQKFLCRVYGEKTEQFIDREAEIHNMRFLHSHKMGPKVHCAFRNGLCYDYFCGQTFNLEMVIDPKYAFKIAEHMARMHTIPLLPVHGNEAKIGSMLESYLSLVPPKMIVTAERRLQDEFGGQVNIAREVASMKKMFESIQCAVVFCHNDLLPKNIVLGEQGVHFIDYEYASSNYQAFDIGNYFTEFGGQEFYDRSLYPTKDWQLRWITCYLTEFARLKGNKPPSEEDTSKMYVEVNKLALSSMLLWGIWALIQANNSTIDVDFAGFAHLRLGMYFFKRDEFLAL